MCIVVHISASYRIGYDDNSNILHAINSQCQLNLPQKNKLYALAMTLVEQSQHVAHRCSHTTTISYVCSLFWLLEKDHPVCVAKKVSTRESLRKPFSIWISYYIT